MRSSSPGRLFPARVASTHTELTAAKDLIESHIKDADVTVSRPRTASQDHGDDHHAAIVVLSVFEGRLFVRQHQLVYDALDDHMTTDIHVIEPKTYMLEEYAVCEE